MDDPEFWENYFIDYFGNIVENGKIGLTKNYDITDFTGMNKANAMDIIFDEYSAHKHIPPHLSFEVWFQTIKYSPFYNAVYIYLFDAYHDTPTNTEKWFRSFYNLHI
jgi:hypothetical protein